MLERLNVSGLLPYKVMSLNPGVTTVSSPSHFTQLLPIDSAVEVQILPNTGANLR